MGLDCQTCSDGQRANAEDARQRGRQTNPPRSYQDRSQRNQQLVALIRSLGASPAGQLEALERAQPSDLQQPLGAGIVLDGICCYSIRRFPSIGALLSRSPQQAGNSFVSRACTTELL